jgi:hypothetical protein
MAKLVTHTHALVIRDDDGSTLLAEPPQTTRWTPGTLLPQRVVYTVTADTEQTLTIPSGCKHVVIDPGAAEELKLRASSGGATVLVFTPATAPTQAPISFPIDASVTTAIYLYNDDASSRTIAVTYT